MGFVRKLCKMLPKGTVLFGSILCQVLKMLPNGTVPNGMKFSIWAERVWLHFVSNFENDAKRNRPQW